jgi:hypothetical protein
LNGTNLSQLVFIGWGRFHEQQRCSHVEPKVDSSSELPWVNGEESLNPNVGCLIPTFSAPAGGNPRWGWGKRMKESREARGGPPWALGVNGVAVPRISDLPKS